MKGYVDWNEKKCLPAASVSYDKNLTEFFYSDTNYRVGIARSCTKKVCNCDYLGYDPEIGKNFQRVLFLLVKPRYDLKIYW